MEMRTASRVADKLINYISSAQCLVRVKSKQVGELDINLTTMCWILVEEGLKVHFNRNTETDVFSLR